MIVFLVIVVAGFSTSACQNTTNAPNTTDALTLGMLPGDKFYYFAYGSNLLEKRIHINNPTAVRVSAAKLMHFRLDFGYWSERWKGATATIVAEEDEHLWGAVWEINRSDIDNLDRQEGVEAGIYYPVGVEVIRPNGGMYHCRSYKLVDTPIKLTPGQPIPDNRLPSELYMNVIIKGARESNLPNDYIERLLEVPHNSYKGDNNTKLASLVSG